MRILWLSHLVPYPPKAGVLLRSYNLVKELSRYHDVDLLAFSQKSLIEPYFESYEFGLLAARDKMKEYCGRVKFVESPNDTRKLGKLKCAIASLFSKYPYNINWLQSNEYKEILAAWVADKSYDVIHFDTISLALYVDGLIGMVGNAILSLDHHNIESHMLIRRATKENNILKKVYFLQEGYRLKAIERSYCPRFDLNITCSQLDSERLLSFCPDVKCVNVPNGVDLESFVPSSVPPVPYSFIFIGTLDWYPNREAVEFIAEELWPRLKQIYPEAQVHVIGANPSKKLVDLTEREEDFFVHGYVENLESYLEAATIYLCPISDGGGTKLKILDAFASGKAVVGHPVAFEGIGVTDGVNAEFAGSVKQYLEKIDKIVTNCEHRLALEKAARCHVEEHFSFESIGSKLASNFIQTKSNSSCAG